MKCPGDFVPGVLSLTALGFWGLGKARHAFPKHMLRQANVQLTTRNVECEGGGDTMQLIRIILSQRGILGFMLSKRECAFGNGYVSTGRSGRIHRLKIHDMK